MKGGGGGGVEGKDDIFVEADNQRLTQVISNLISNALKFMSKEKEGLISIILEKQDHGDGNADAIITVKDTGTGIDPEIFPRLFSKFASKSFQGTGLGLFISKSIVEAHGGKMWAKNNNTDGATFHFSIPISKKQ